MSYFKTFTKLSFPLVESKKNATDMMNSFPQTVDGFPIETETYWTYQKEDVLLVIHFYICK